MQNGFFLYFERLEIEPSASVAYIAYTLRYISLHIRYYSATVFTAWKGKKIVFSTTVNIFYYLLLDYEGKSK